MKHDGWERIDRGFRGWTMTQFNEWVAIFPTNDLYEHRIDCLDCPCQPYWNVGARVLTHHAFDGRDIVEAVEVGAKLL